MNLRVVAYCLIAIELAIQVFGLIYSDQTPQVGVIGHFVLVFSKVFPVQSL